MEKPRAHDVQPGIGPPFLPNKRGETPCRIFQQNPRSGHVRTSVIQA